MATEVGQIVVIDSQSWSTCALCREGVGQIDDMHGFEVRVNHLLADHGATLQHIGQHTGVNMDGDAMQHVVAVLGLPTQYDVNDSPPEIL